MQRDEDQICGVFVKNNENGTKWISGNTFDINEYLKKAKGIWCSQEKAWLLPQEFDTAEIAGLKDQAKAKLDSELESRQNIKLVKHCNAFKVKDKIIAGGGSWNPERRGWIVPASFDESIIPPDDRQRDENGNVIKKASKCSFCSSEDHKKNKCPCTNCRMIGLHPTKDCPTIDPNYRKTPNCRCSPIKVCDVCKEA